MKCSNMYVSPDGEHCLLIGEKGTLFNVDLRVRRPSDARQLASPIRHASFYDNDTCYMLTGTGWVSARWHRRQHDRGVRHTYEHRASELLGPGSLRRARVACVWRYDVRRVVLDHHGFMFSDSAGICSLYSTPTQMSTEATSESYRLIHPMKVFKNLVTGINAIDINNDNSMMVYASVDKMDQIRAVHIPSLTVFSNWPAYQEHVGNVQSLSISGDNREGSG